MPRNEAAEALREARMAERNYQRSLAVHTEIAAQRRAAIVRCVGAGIPPAVVARQFKVSRQYINNLLREAAAEEAAS